MKKLFLIPFLAFALGCQQEELPPPSAPPPTTQNTPGPNWVSINSDTIQLGGFRGYFIDSSNVTHISGVDTTGSGGGVVLFIPCTGVDSVTITSGGSGANPTNSGPFYCPQYVTVIVERYDAVNGLIEGRHYGVWHDCISTSQQVNIEGRFSVVREADH